MSIQNIKDKLRQIFNNIRTKYANYKVTYAAIVAVTLYSAIIEIIYDGFDIGLPFDDMFMVRALVIFGVASAFIETLAAFLAENSIRTSIEIPVEDSIRTSIETPVEALIETPAKDVSEGSVKRKSVLKTAAFLAAAVIAVIAAFNIGLEKDEQILQLSGEFIREVTVRLLAGYLLLLALGIIYYSFKKAKIGFEEYALKLALNLAKIYVIYFILTTGAFIIYAVFELFFIDGYSGIDSVCTILITGFYFAPGCLKALSDMDKEPSDFFKLIVKYVLSCMTICAMAVVYLYLLKIIIMWEIPSNEIFYIVAALFCLGMPVWITAGYYKGETKYSKLISVLPYIFAPLIVLQIYSIGIRVYQYGMTNERYLGFMLIIFEIGTVVIWKLCKQKYELIIHLLAVLIVIAVFVPVINMESASNIWQKHFLQKYYQAVLDGKTITDTEYKRMMGAYDYLSDKPKMQAVVNECNVHDELFVLLAGEHKSEEEKLTDYEFYNIHCCQMVGDLQIDGYNKFSMLNQDESYDSVNKINGSAAENRGAVDFSQFKFIRREDGEEIVVDISDFAERCMEYAKESPYASKEIASEYMKAYNKISLGDGRLLYINHFEVRYSEGIKDGADYFAWNEVNISAMLLEE